jgi:hypothetical protein
MNYAIFKLVKGTLLLVYKAMILWLNKTLLNVNPLPISVLDHLM